MHSVDQFLIGASYGYASTAGNFALRYHVNILGWNKTSIKETEPFSEVYKTKNDILMNLIYTFGKTWLKSYLQLPYASSSIPGCEMTRFDDDTFMNFAPYMKKYNLPDSGGSYLSRFNNDSSHIILTIALESVINYKSIYLTVILFDFNASQSISNLFHIFNETLRKSRKILKERIIKAANKFSQTFKYINMFISIIDEVFVMPNVDHHDESTLS